MPTPADDVLRLQNFQGISVMNVREGDSGWVVVVDSPFNRRIHHNTPMIIDGPAAGHDLLKTDADPTGTASLQTRKRRLCVGTGWARWCLYGR